MTYAGLCIDGPMDGQWAEMQMPKMQVNVRPPQKLTASFDEQAAMLDTVETICYDWHEPGLWLLEGVGPEAARIHMAEAIGTEALASRYEQVVARRKDDERHGR